MAEYLLDVEETLLLKETQMLQGYVKEGLGITLVEQTPYPGSLFGGIFQCYNTEDAMSRWATMVIRTLQRMEPCPTMARLSVHRARGKRKYLVRLAVPK